MTDEERVRALFGFGETRKLPSRYWEIGWEDANDEEPDEKRELNYDEEELPFC